MKRIKLAIVAISLAGCSLEPQATHKTGDVILWAGMAVVAGWFVLVAPYNSEPPTEAIEE